MCSRSADRNTHCSPSLPLTSVSISIKLDMSFSKICALCSPVFNMTLIHNACELIIDCLCIVRFCVSVAEMSKGKGKFILEQATKAQKGSRVIALLFP